MISVNPLLLTGCLLTEVLHTSVDIDPHIIFNFNAPQSVMGAGLLFLRDVNGALVELMIDQQSGRLCGASLTIAPPKLENSLPIRAEALARKQGLPVFGHHGFDRDDIMPRRDRQSSISAILAGDMLTILIDTAQPDTIILCGRALFLLSNGVLTGLGAADLTISERSTIRQSFV
jgi:hypothetical protein